MRRSQLLALRRTAPAAGAAPLLLTAKTAEGASAPVAAVESREEAPAVEPHQAPPVMTAAPPAVAAAQENAPAAASAPVTKPLGRPMLSLKRKPLGEQAWAMRHGALS
jgi:hypothetical protein